MEFENRVVVITGGAQGIGKALALTHQVINGIGLVAVGHDMGLAQRQHRIVNNEAGVLQLRGVRCDGADAAALGHGVKHAVAAVLAAAHDKVANEHLAAIRSHCHSNAAAGILVGCQILVQVDLFHVKFSYYGTPPVACGDSPLGEGALPPSLREVARRQA